MKVFKERHFLGATLLIAGTSIGVGMLALPVATAEGGFFPSLPIYIVVWLFMLSMSRLIVEGCLWCPKGSNLVTICRTLVGKKGAAVCWILYLFLFYCLMVAHTVAGGASAEGLILVDMPNWLSTLIYVLVFAPAVYLGTRWVDRVNTVLMAGVVITFIFFCFDAIPYVNVEYLTRGSFTGAVKALPVLLTAFGFQNLVPTLVDYTQRNDKLLMKAIWVGTSIPLGLYFIWQFLIHGVVPYETLEAAFDLGHNAVVPLQETLQKSNIAKIGSIFAFFAMTTSFLGISMALFDFWADGLKWEKKGIKKLYLMGLVFAVPYAIACVDPSIFFIALTWAGGVGVAILFGILPILFIWSGRYIQKRSATHRELPGGKITLSILFAFCLPVIYQMLGL